MNNGERHHFEKGSAMATAQEQASRFEQALISNSLKYDRIDDFERPMFKLNFGGGDFSFNHLRINILFDTDGRSAQFATSPIVSIPKDGSGPHHVQHLQQALPLGEVLHRRRQRPHPRDRRHHRRCHRGR